MSDTNPAIMMLEIFIQLWQCFWLNKQLLDEIIKVYEMFAKQCIAMIIN